MNDDPAVARVASDLLAPSFRAGVIDRRWRVVSRAFPTLYVEIAAIEPDESRSWYCFQLEVGGYPGQAPQVRIWDLVAGQSLAVERRPKGNRRVLVAFQKWQEDTVYRPWERKTGPHNNNRTTFPHLAWHAGRSLAFVVEDLHGILNLNARAGSARAAA